MYRVFLLLVALAFSACATEPNRRVESEAVQHQVSVEIARICGLAAAERQAEIDRVRNESGMAIVCPNH